MIDRAAYFERIERAGNIARFYRLAIVPTLLGQWSVVREWGRIGTRGSSREHWCGSFDEACRLLAGQRSRRVKRGYEERQSVQSRPADACLQRDDSRTGSAS